MGKKTFEASEWQEPLQSYCYYEENHRRLVKFRALTFGILILSVSMILFVITASPESGLLWLFCAMAGVVISLPLSIVVRTRLRRVEGYKNDLARRFFAAGLRVEDDSLVTNVAHPKVIVTLNHKKD